MKILINKKTNQKHLVKDTSADFHTSEGVISKKDLKSNKVIKTNKNKEFIVLEPNFIDLWEKIKRGPQVIIQKDIGLIITKTGINKESRIVDAGGGSGSLCCYLAHLTKEVTTYEIQKDLIPILKHNQKLFGLQNLNIKNKSIYDGITEKNLDLITLDLAQPWQVVESAQKALKLGGFLVVYLPNIMQMKMFADSIHNTSFQLIEVEELIERKWKVEDKVVRPEYEMLGHTGFLCFCRRF